MKIASVASVTRFALTLAIVAVAALVAHALWRHYMYSPWTRDGRVRAEVVQVAPDVSGLVARVDVQDNQFVHKGDVLFEIDASRFENAVEQAKARLQAARAAASAAGADIASARASAARAQAEYAMRAAQARRRRAMGDTISREARSDAAATAQAAHAGLDAARAGHTQATAAQRRALAAVQQATAALDLARLNLRRTRVRAPVDGYVTHLDLYAGDYASAGAARMAVIDSHAFWVDGYFEETKLPHVRVGDPARVRLMDGTRLSGHVQSIARGIAQSDGASGSQLLANVSPTFNWVRLAQRVPVRIRIDTAHMPRDTVLSAGMTATVVLHPRH